MGLPPARERAGVLAGCSRRSVPEWPAFVLRVLRFLPRRPQLLFSSSPTTVASSVRVLIIFANNTSILVVGRCDSIRRPSPSPTASHSEGDGTHREEECCGRPDGPTASVELPWQVCASPLCRHGVLLAARLGASAEPRLRRRGHLDDDLDVLSPLVQSLCPSRSGLAPAACRDCGNAGSGTYPMGAAFIAHLSGQPGGAFRGAARHPRPREERTVSLQTSQPPQVFRDGGDKRGFAPVAVVPVAALFASGFRRLPPP
jgi:hypothetical protein